MGGGGCNHPPTSEAGAAIFGRRRGRGTAPTGGGGGGEEGGEKQRSPGRALGKQGVGVGDPGACSPALPAIYPAPRGGGGDQDKNPNRAAPAGELRRAPPPRQPAPAAASTCRGGARPPPRSRRGRHKVFAPAPERRQLAQSPPPSHSPPPPARTYAPLPGRGHRARAPRRPVSPPRARQPRLRPAREGGVWLPARSLGSYRRSHSGGSCPGAVGGRPRGTRELGRGGGTVGVGGGTKTTSPHPRPARRAHLSCQGPAAPPRLTHAGATVAQCLSKLLISPGAARRRRRRLGPAGEVELPGPRPRNTCCCRRRRGHTQAQRRPLPGHWLAPGSLTSASGRCRVSATNTRARTDRRPGTPARAHAPPQPGGPGEPRTPAGRGKCHPRVPGGPSLDC